MVSILFLRLLNTMSRRIYTNWPRTLCTLFLFISNWWRLLITTGRSSCTIIKDSISSSPTISFSLCFCPSTKPAIFNTKTKPCRTLLSRSNKVISTLTLRPFSSIPILIAIIWSIIASFWSAKSSIRPILHCPKIYSSRFKAISLPILICTCRYGKIKGKLLSLH